VAFRSGRFFSSITERRITQVRKSSAPEARGTHRIPIHSRNAHATALRNRADGDRCRSGAVFIRTGRARNRRLNFTISRSSDKHLFGKFVFLRALFQKRIADRVPDRITFRPRTGASARVPNPGEVAVRTVYVRRTQGPAGAFCGPIRESTGHANRRNTSRQGLALR
jgi:hypothetical protein